MANRAITSCVPEEKLPALDSVAERQPMDRALLLNEAVTQYLSLHGYHRDLVEEDGCPG